MLLARICIFDISSPGMPPPGPRATFRAPDPRICMLAGARGIAKMVGLARADKSHECWDAGMLLHTGPRERRWLVQHPLDSHLLQPVLLWSDAKNAVDP